MTLHEPNSGVSRREFVAGTLVGAGALALGNSAEAAPRSNLHTTESTTMTQTQAAPFQLPSLPYADTAVHELAHLLEHHLAGMARPRWFAEGFASLVTGDTRQASLDDVAWWVIHEGGPRPLERMFAVRGACVVHVAYAIAREALVYLVELVGEAGIKRMFDKRHAGASFEAAFRDVAGLGLDEFQAQFAQWLKPHYYERAR